MDIVEEIHCQLQSFIKKNYRKPEYLYLGYEDYAKLKAALPEQYRQHTYQPTQGNLNFNGLEVIVVATQNHLNFGFKD